MTAQEKIQEIGGSTFVKVSLGTVVVVGAFVVGTVIGAVTWRDQAFADIDARIERKLSGYVTTVDLYRNWEPRFNKMDAKLDLIIDRMERQRSRER